MANAATKEAVRKLDKRIGMLRFRMKHAGTGRKGAPAGKLTAARRKEMGDQLKALLAERDALRGKLTAKPKKKEEAKPATPRLKAGEKKRTGAKVRALVAA